MNECYQLSKKRVVFYLIVVCTILALLLIYTGINNGYYDLLVSKILVTLEPGERFSKSFFGKFYEIFGEVPIYLLISFSVMLVERVIKFTKINNVLKLILRIILICGSIFSTVYFYHCIMRYTYSVNTSCFDDFWCELFSLSLLISLPLAIITNIGLYFLIAKLNLEPKQVIRFVFVVGMAILLTHFTISFIKGFVQRNRYRAMMFLDYGKFDYFTPWYQRSSARLDLLGAIKDDFRSFPSGHTSSACSLIAIMLFPIYFKEFNKKYVKDLCVIIPFLHIILTMFGRVVMGAHYLSDVSFAALISVLYFAVFYSLDGFLNKKNVYRIIDRFI